MDTIRHETRFPCPKLTILLPDYIFSMYEAYQVWPQARGRDLKPTVSNINQEGLLPQRVPVVGLSHLEITYGCVGNILILRVSMYVHKIFLNK